MANNALPHRQYSTEVIGSALYQYYTGESLSDVRGHIMQQNNLTPAESAIYYWINHFSKLATDKANEYHPKVGDEWIADETVISINGKNYWLWDIIDSDTRFLLATHMSETRTIKGAQKLMELASERAGKAPKIILTDKLAAYIDGIELTFGSETKHIQSKPFTTEEESTNKIERWHGTLKERLKVMRDLKSTETARQILDGWLVYYNYFRPHESLNDKTSAEVAGIKFPYKDWLDVVKSDSPLAVESKGQVVMPTGNKPIHIYPKEAYRKRPSPTRRHKSVSAGITSMR